MVVQCRIEWRTRLNVGRNFMAVVITNRKVLMIFWLIDSRFSVGIKQTKPAWFSSFF